MKPIKLIITEKGDPSVGIFDQSWEVEFPILMDPEKLTNNDKMELEFFRETAVDLYLNYCEGKCIGEYDFELKYPDEI